MHHTKTNITANENDYILYIYLRKKKLKQLKYENLFEKASISNSLCYFNLLKKKMLKTSEPMNVIAF